jgi:hypothetical protein
MLQDHRRAQGHREDGSQSASYVVPPFSGPLHLDDAGNPQSPSIFMSYLISTFILIPHEILSLYISICHNVPQQLGTSSTLSAFSRIFRCSEKRKNNIDLCPRHLRRCLRNFNVLKRHGTISALSAFFRIFRCSDRTMSIPITFEAVARDGAKRVDFAEHYDPPNSLSITRPLYTLQLSF